MGELIGWRIWRVKHGYLTSFSADTAWPPDEPMTGKPGDHDGAGVWAFKEQSRAIKKMIESGNEFAYGSVRLWGEVIEHSDGYRAEFARVLTIDDVILKRGDANAVYRKFSHLFGSPNAELIAELRRRYLRDDED